MIVIVGSVVTSVIGRDAFLYPATESLSSEFTESRVKIAEKPLGLDWSNKEKILNDDINSYIRILHGYDGIYSYLNIIHQVIHQVTR
jgi:hypothetical protein